MSWVKVDDKAWSHPKFAGLTGNAVRLWLFAMCWSAGHETDGRLPKVVLRTLGATQKEAKALVDVGLWHETPDGWEVHDFLEYQPSAVENRTRREAKVQAGRVGGRRSAETRSTAKPKQQDEHEPSRPEAPASPLVEADAKQNPTPDPDPDPDPDPQTTTGGGGLIPVPEDLQLTAKQAASLSVTPGVPAWAQARITAEFIAKNQADPNDKRSLVTWRKCLAGAVSGTWNDPRRRPKPESTTRDLLEGPGPASAEAVAKRDRANQWLLDETNRKLGLTGESA